MRGEAGRGCELIGTEGQGCVGWLRERWGTGGSPNADGFCSIPVKPPPAHPCGPQSHRLWPYRCQEWVGKLALVLGPVCMASPCSPGGKDGQNAPFFFPHFFSFLLILLEKIRGVLAEPPSEQTQGLCFIYYIFALLYGGLFVRFFLLLVWKEFFLHL